MHQRKTREARAGYVRRMRYFVELVLPLSAAFAATAAATTRAAAADCSGGVHWSEGLGL